MQRISTRNRVIIIVAAVTAVTAVLLATRHSGPAGKLRAGFGAEFLTRPDGYKGLSRAYGFEFAAPPLHMELGLMYRAAADGAIDVICGFATDGRIPAYDLFILKDDKGFFPPYYAAPLVRIDTLQRHPEIEGILNRLGGKVPDEKMQRLNYEVDELGRKPVNVAREFLEAEGLIPPGARPGDGSAGVVVIGSKEFTEQEILGQMMAILIESHSDIKVERRLNLGGTMICFAAIKAGDLDLYPEYTGTALVNIMKHDVISDPDKTYAVVQEAFNEEYGLKWLDPFGLNNTYTITMRKEHAERLGINTISELAEYINRK